MPLTLHKTCMNQDPFLTFLSDALPCTVDQATMMSVADGTVSARRASSARLVPDDLGSNSH